MAEDARDPWHFPRRELAENYVRHYGPIQSLTLFSERRTGKTTFARNDLAPVAADYGYQPVYIDLWTHQKDATTALVDGLRTAALDLATPKTRAGKVLNQPVKGLSLPGLGSIDFGGVPQRGEPDDPLLRIRHWSDKVVHEAKKPVFLIVDEVQQIGVDKNGEATAAALRAALQRHDRNLVPFFTGSSADRLAAMFDDTGAAFYQFGTRVQFPRLDREFVEHIADRHKESTRGTDLDRDGLWKAFQALDNRPGPLREMVNSMLLAADTKIDEHLSAQLGKEQDRARKALSVKELSPVQIAVLSRLAHDLPLFSESARRYYSDFLDNKRITSPGTVSRAVRALQDKQLIHAGTGRADYRLNSQAMGKVLRGRYKTAGKDHERQMNRGRGKGLDVEPER